jgi:hypothetical protein
MQWLPEPFCVLPPESPAVAAVIAAGCPDSFRFVPNRVAADSTITPGTPVTLDLATLPAADVMVGDVTARIAYASLIVYDDRNENRMLDLRHPPQQRHHDEGPEDAPGPYDVVYGASFISMTQPDRRLAFREGGFNDGVAFYPRFGCEPPPKGFSLLSAGGFSQTAALVSALQGQLPAEDPTTCSVSTLDDTVVIPLQAPTSLTQLACTSNDSGGVTNYRQAPADGPTLAGHTWACAGFPQLPGDVAGVAQGQQLVVAGVPADACQSITHYTLRGCDNDPSCATPSWDFTSTPPTWWPCPSTP